MNKKQILSIMKDNIKSNLASDISPSRYKDVREYFCAGIKCNKSQLNKPECIFQLPTTDEEYNHFKCVIPFGIENKEIVSIGKEILECNTLKDVEIIIFKWKLLSCVK